MVHGCGALLVKPVGGWANGRDNGRLGPAGCLVGAAGGRLGGRAHRQVRQAACARSPAGRRPPQPAESSRGGGELSRAVSTGRGWGTCFGIADFGADFFPDFLDGKTQ